MILSHAAAPADQLLSPDSIRQTLAEGLESLPASGRVLVLIPDDTRTVPLPLLFKLITQTLSGVKQLDFLVALGTHPPLSEARLNQLVGITAEARRTTYRHIGIFNHDWQSDGALATLGVLTEDRVKTLAGSRWHPTLAGDIPIRINRKALEYDQIIILGPTFPHEVAGFSGGAKYLFPGISGPEMIHKTHWLSAMAGVRGTIGIQDTPMRALIHAAAGKVPTPITLIALVVEGDGLAGIFVGDLLGAWQAAAELSSRRHILRVDSPFQRILSCAAPMYGELWTAGKAMYKLEPVLAAGGELIIYNPDLRIVSEVHGRHIFEIGYHVLPYFLKQWDRFRHVPLGVLAHSTHVRGDGDYIDGVERPHARVTLATGISPEDCARLNLGYQDPASIDPDEWKGKEAEGVLVVPKAGERLYKIAGDK